MSKIDPIKENANLDKLTSTFLRSLPDGKIYGEAFRSFFKGFLGVYQDLLIKFNKACNDLFYITASSYYLEEMKIMYGLPNVIFPNISSNDDAVFAINMMRLSQTLISQE